ncbi:type I-D CRISPR-associated helicase Cas3' [Phormidesmis priestleyi ULC007]|uniref:Type I-D CRISPR-associated helicase Cas3 n=1 Tax=Phormidesmis priestleyi ULC007 TaxID=1920490 RepID=A0A2T1DI66_9CYAN|nr:type I-D CRISPR-associated helicase Cas3' [Phormidesmis priestleyi]PSB20200.1 type I-D CRISPR-associated helicase Cas3' [Phormidesmis priestleyi ULC007]
MIVYTTPLKPVYSQTVQTPQGVNLPEGWVLSWHQAATLEALRDAAVDVVFNSAMTGDGKSLAAFLEVFQGECNAIALYPTNELARDQETQTRQYIADFQPPNNPRVTRLSGAELETYAENEDISKGAAIATRTSQSEILLTNPDIFHFLHRGAYIIKGNKGDSPDKLWGRIDKDFDLFIFDEFHVYAAPQVASVINTMLLIRSTNRRKKFLFLSATPDIQLMGRLEKAGFRCRTVSPIEQNKYQFPETLEQQQQLKTQNWRQVARAIALNFVSLEPVAKASESWLKDNANLILQQFQQHPHSKGAIILNSIAAVKRLTPFFQALLHSQGLVVSENTGLSGKSERERSLMADLVLGTSTIDVGVDFKINFLIFESSDAGNFIQRLGRLGRHDGYERNGQTFEFDQFTAYALVPNFLVERLFLSEEPPLVDGESRDRLSFNTVINEKYRQINDFRGYYKQWGAVQSFKLYMDLNHQTIRQQYAGSREQFQTACETVFETSLSRVAGRVSGWAKDWQQLSGQKTGNPIAEDACSFRGSSPLQCGLYDETELHEADRYKTYDLPGILGNLEIELWTKEAFLRSLDDTAKRTGQPIPKGKFAHCLAFMKLKAYREERLNWKFHVSGSLETIADGWKVQVLKGVEIWQPDNRWAGEINRKLRDRALVSYVLHRPISEVRQRLRLPMHFQIYPISDNYSFHDAVAPYSIAFGQSALLLDTLAYQFKSKGGDPYFA